MQEIHVGLFIVFPCRTAEARSPVIWLFSVFFAFSPDIKITVWIIHALTALYKPCMFIGRMVYHKIHHDLDPKLMGTGEHPVIIFHRSKFCHDRLIIADIISVVIIRRLINR